MSVKYQNPEYDRMYPIWKRCRDCATGQRVIHSQGTEYLPMLSNQSGAEYEAYKKRTPFFNATWRTVDGLRGMIFRKPAKISASEKMLEMFKDVTMNGKSLHMFAMDVVEESLKVGRCGIFIDYPETDDNITMADVKTKNLRPLMKLYKAESIINWKTKSVNNVVVLTMIVLTESAAAQVDEFEDEFTTQYRVLDLVEIPLADSIKTVYRVRVFTVNSKGDDVLLSTVYPTVDSQFLSEIPFQFIGTDDNSSDVDEPPLVDLVDINISHYQTSADYEHGCHFTGLPTPVISGYTVEKEGEKFCIGSTTAWVFPNPQAKASYLEFTGQGLGSLENNLAKKENYMAVLGARMLEAQANAVEAANTAAIHRGGEQSTLSSIALAVSIGLSKAAKYFGLFAGDTEDAKIELNRDFFPIPMDSLQLTALVAAWMNSAISYETMHDNLKKGEIVPVERTAEEEQAEIKANPPPVPEAGATPGSPAPNTPVGGKADDKTQTELQRNSVK